MLGTGAYVRSDVTQGRYFIFRRGGQKLGRERERGIGDIGTITLISRSKVRTGAAGRRKEEKEPRDESTNR